MDKTWEPTIRPISPELMDEVLALGALSPEEVAMLLFLPAMHPAVRSAAFRLYLFRLETRGAPVQ